MDGSERRGAAPSAGVSMRPATVADADAMARLADAAYETYVSRIGKKPAPMLADYPGVVRHGRTWVAEHAGQLVGFVVLDQAADHLLVENVAVHPASQGLGIGRRLLAVAEDRARELGLPELRLYTNEMMSENVAYYPRRGYRETHRAVQDGYRRVFFTKPLP
ncbi:MAG TPA: GNAT family N-acetyltransferase [Pseudonocardia sp.]|nr:GNAT family N-acetyltransferase [Pseudonocardia sp.]